MSAAAPCLVLVRGEWRPATLERENPARWFVAVPMRGRVLYRWHSKAGDLDRDGKRRVRVRFE